MLMPPIKDIAFAEEKKLIFDICIKSGRGQKWISKDTVNSDLIKALEIVKSYLNNHYEVGLFVVTKGGDFVYWKSSNSDLFNSRIFLSLNFD